MSEDLDLIDFALKKIDEPSNDNSFLDDSINKDSEENISYIPNDSQNETDIQQIVSPNGISSIHEFQPSESIGSPFVSSLKKKKIESPVKQENNINDVLIESNQYEIDISLDYYDDLLNEAFNQLIQETHDSEDIDSDPSTPKDKNKRKLPAWMSESKALDKQLRKKIFSITQTRSRSKIELANSIELNITSDETYELISDPTLISKGRVICFDLETTGFSKDDGIIEIGAVEYVNGIRTGAIFQSYIRPNMQVNFFASKVHGLTNKKLESAPPIEIILNSFMNWVGDAPLVAHNALFDMRMYVLLLFIHFEGIYLILDFRLTQECKRLGIEDKLNGKKVFCTMKYHRNAHPRSPYALVDLFLFYIGQQRFEENIVCFYCYFII